MSDFIAEPVRVEKLLVAKTCKSSSASLHYTDCVLFLDWIQLLMQPAQKGTRLHMFEKLSKTILKNELIWLYMAAFFIVIPTNLLVGVATAVVLEPASTWEFARIVLSIFIPPLVVVTFFGAVAVYPFEQLVVKDKALTSLRWVGIRTGFMMLIAVPVAFIAVTIARQMAVDLPTSFGVFQVYLFAAVLEGFMVSIAFAFFEYVFTEIAKREDSLTQQLQELRLEIDVIKKEKSVAEITDSDEFMNLKARAQELRNKNNPA